MEAPPVHVVVVPYPMPGHINPMLQLAEALASSENGCVVTFVNTEYNQKVYEKREGTVAIDRASGRLRMVGLSDGLPLDGLYDRHSAKFLGQDLPLHKKPQLKGLLQELNGSPTPVSCIIADLFMPWLHSLDLACSSPPLIGFCPTCVAQFATIYRLPQLVSSRQLSPVDGSLQNATSLDTTTPTTTTRVSVLPGLLAFEARNLPWFTGDPQDGARVFQFVMNIRQQYMPVFRAIVINSFLELESEIVDALEGDANAEASRMKILTLGPLLLLHNEVAPPPEIASGIVGDGNPELTQRKGGIGSTFNDITNKRQCWEWLQGKDESSVLYVSFGTTASVSREELHELALGIEAAGVPFLWAIRADQLVMGGDDEPCLPLGFVERTKKRAFFTPWAPQTLVLSHPAVGAFLTHCGWNSVIEAMSMGVPMVTWPYKVDQKGNSQLIVETWKIGLPLREWGADREAVSRRKVEKLVTCLLHKGRSEQGQQIRERAAAVKREARRAVAMGGSSDNNCRKLIQLIKSFAAPSHNLSSDAPS